MLYTIQWADEACTMVHQTYDGDVSRQEFETMVENSNRMLAGVSHPVDLIIEWKGERQIMQDLSLIYGAMFAEKHVPANQRFVFVINLPQIYRILAHVLRRSAPRAMGAMYFVDSVEDVYRLRNYLLETGVSSVS